MSDIHADLEELTTHCIRCGFCLESCPTFTETASELESPRGRIYLVRSALEGKLKWQEDVKEHLDQCLGCRACETACPSAVEYGLILELARDRIESERPQWAKRLLLEGITNPALLKAQLAVGKLLPFRRLPQEISRAISAQKVDHAEADLPVAQRLPDWPPVISAEPVKGEVYFLEGCAMRVLFPRANLAAKRLLRRIGYTVHEVRQGCCGALHAHNGDLKTAQRMAEELAEAMPGDLPVIVDSAGCGSTMKAYEDTHFAHRVKDVSEFLAEHGLIEKLKEANGLPLVATYHDACHLAHGQKITQAPRFLLEAIPNLTLVPLPEADTCCGSAGIYNLTEPAMARRLLDRKWTNVAATGARVVATGNPGCQAWIAQAAREHGQTVDVLHTVELLEAAFIGIESFLSGSNG